MTQSARVGRRRPPAPAPTPAPAPSPAAAQPAAAGPVIIFVAFALVVVSGGALLLGPPAVLLAVCLVAGVGLTYLSGLTFDFEERLAYGAVVGAMTVALATFATALLLGLNLVTVVVGCVLALVASAVGWAVAGDTLSSDLTSLGSRWIARPDARHPWPLLLVLAICWPFAIHLLGQAYVYKSTGLYAGYVNIWGDWAAHLTFAGSFIYGSNFPPEYPIDPGHHLGYPFMIDFLAATLVPLGSSLTSALVLTSGYMGLAFPAVFYLAATRLTGSRLAALLGLFVFVLGGGLGFTYLFGDLDRLGPAVFDHLPREYTLDRRVNYQWLNPVLAYLLPQRSILFGLTVPLIVLTTLWRAVREPETSWRPFLAAGVVIGLMPLFHVHGYATTVVLAAVWALFIRQRRWVTFFAPALVLGLPTLAWMWPPAAAQACSVSLSHFSCRFALGWMAASNGHNDPIWWFWLKNTSLFIPLLLVAQFWRSAVPTGFALYHAPLWLWFLVPNVVLLEHWDWDNTKFFVFWYAFGAVLVGGALAALFKHSPPATVLAAACVILLCLSGGLDLYRASNFSQNSVQFTDPSGLAVADWARENTEPDAVFLVAPEHNHPIPTLGGRRVMVGFPGWLWTYGLDDFQSKTDDAELMLKGDPQTPELVRKYRIDYVVIGPAELSPQHRASAAYWNQHATRVYANREYTVYRVKTTQ
jgi:hypothetical protein